MPAPPRVFDRLMASAMQAVPVPAGLRERLVTAGAKKQGDAFRQKIYRGGSLVAAAMVLVALGMSVFFNTTRPRVNTDELVQRADEQRNTPQEYTRRWLAEQKLPNRLPWNFDYDLLIDCGYHKVAGKMVPVVTFRAPAGAGFAKVYMFRDGGDHDTKGIQDAQASHFRAEVLIGQANYRGVTYVIVHSGAPNEGLQRFLKSTKGGLPL